jgi:hypothetical protein
MVRLVNMSVDESRVSGPTIRADGLPREPLQLPYEE